jgi:hypothetical protein
MIYLNKCPKCNSNKVSISKTIRFRKTMWIVLLLSSLLVLGYLDDARRLGELQQSDFAGYNAFIMNGAERLSNEMTTFLLIIIVLWIAAIGLFSVKKVEYCCKDCNLKWRS